MGFKLFLIAYNFNAQTIVRFVKVNMTVLVINANQVIICWESNVCQLVRNFTTWI